ncbi:MAG: hypothetical protein EOP84_32620, partial [Verrucomicrobiaceae bacterium]
MNSSLFQSIRCFFAVTVLLALAAPAQQPGESQPNVVASASVTAIPLGPPDPRVIKQLETLLNQKFSREPGDIFYALERGVSADLATLNSSDRLLHFFRTSDWMNVRAEFAMMPPDLARRIYEKMLADLTEKQKPGVRLDDVLAIADAAPQEFTSDQVRRLGQLLGLVVPLNESYWLAERLKRGTEKLGGSDPGKRLLTGR